MRAVALEGYFGEGNAGDDAFSMVAGDLLGGRGYSVRVLGRPALAPTCAKDVEFVLPQDGGVRLSIAKWKAQSGLVVHFGGSTFRRMNTRRRDEALLARAGLIRQFATGVSIGPFRSSSDEQDVAAFLRRFRRISTRDVASERRIEGLGLDVDHVPGFDPAVLLPEVLRLPQPGWDGRRFPTKSSRPVLGISVRPFETFEDGDPESEERRANNLVNMLRSLARSGVAIRLLALNRHPRKGDLAMSRRIVAAIGGDSATIELYDGDLAKLCRAIGTCDAVIAMRLHAAVFAFSMGVPFGIIDYHPKCRDFANEVGLLHEARWPTDASGIHDRDAVEDLVKGRRFHDLEVGEAIARAQAGVNYVLASLSD